MKKFLLDDFMGVCTFGGQDENNGMVKLKRGRKIVSYASPNCIIKQADSIKGLFDTIVIEGYAKSPIFGATVRNGRVFFYAPDKGNAQTENSLTIDSILSKGAEVYGMAWYRDGRYLAKIAKLKRRGGFAAL